MGNPESPQIHDSRRALTLAQEKLRADMEALRATEGWVKLSPRQQKIIEHSLYVQGRSERAADSANTNHPDSSAADHNNQNKQRYENSQNRTLEWYCHAAIWSLEHEQSLTVEKPQHDDIEEPFFDGEYFKPNSFDFLRDKLIKAGFPLVVHVAKAPPPLTLLQSHTFVALGVDATGDVVVWEKAAEQLPFQRSTLFEIYEEYVAEDEKEYYWGIRPLRNKQQIEEDVSRDRV